MTTTTTPRRFTAPDYSTEVFPGTKEYDNAGWQEVIISGKPFAIDETELGITVNKDSKDLRVRCGVGIASLPEESELTPACATHDNAYQNPTWQKYHTRSETDLKLYNDLRSLGASKFVAWTMYKLARIFGSRFWEVRNTNN